MYVSGLASEIEYTLLQGRGRISHVFALHSAQSKPCTSSIFVKQNHIRANTRNISTPRPPLFLHWGLPDSSDPRLCSHSRRNQVFAFIEAESLFSLACCLWIRYSLPPIFPLPVCWCFMYGSPNRIHFELMKTLSLMSCGKHVFKYIFFSKRVHGWISGHKWRNLPWEFDEDVV